MGYGMKYTKTMAKMTGKGFPFKSNEDENLEPTALKYEKNPNDFINRKNQEAYNKTLAERTSLENPEHKGDSEEAIEARQNDHDTDGEGKAQTHPENYAIKEARAGDAQEKKEDEAGQN